MEVVKIRLQAQSHSLADPLEVPRYRNAAHAAYTIVREEGFATLYRGVSLTALRQATNQGESIQNTNLLGSLTNTDRVLFRCQLHDIPGTQETGTQIPTRTHRPTLMAAHGYWPDIRSYGPVLKCTY